MNSGWQIKKLEEICSIELGKTPSRSVASYWDNNKKTQNVWISIADLPHDHQATISDSKEYLSDSGASLCKIVKKGTLLLSFKLSIGRLAYAGCDLYTNEAIAALTIKNEAAITKEYLSWYLTFFDWDKVSEGEEKVKGKTLNKAKLRELNVVLPPLREQQRIVAVLDEAFAGIAKATENAQKNLANARELFESHLQSIFTTKGDGWEEKRLVEITSKLGDGLHGTPRYVEEGEYYFINGNNLQNGIIEYKEKTKRVSLEEYITHKKELNSRTVLVSINGTLGNVAFYNNEKVILGKSACYFNLHENIDKNYIKHLISSPYFIEYAHREATGATIKNVSLKSMRNFIVPLPPEHEQKTISLKLDTLAAETKRLEAIYQQKLNNLAALKQSILQKAFAGELHMDKLAA